MQRSTLLTALLFCALATPGCITGRRSADVDRTPTVDTGVGAAIMLPGDSAPRMPQQGVAPGGTTQTSTGPEGSSGSSSGTPQPTAGPLSMIGASKIDENRHEEAKEDPLILKWMLAPLGVLAAPFVWAADQAAGEATPGPAVPSSAKPAPAPPPPAIDYETQRLSEMERELAQRAASAQPAPSAGVSIADELAALQRAPRSATPDAAQQPSAPVPAPRAAHPTPAPRQQAAPAAPKDRGADGIVDSNGDGRIDEWIYRKQGQVVRKALDTDADGRVDRTLHYDAATQELRRVEEDDDHDGVSDAWTLYRDGKVVRRRADADGDGEVDTWSFYANGLMTRHEQDTTGDGFRDRIGFYNADSLAREEYDQDGDGVADVINYFDASETISRREEDVDHDGVIDVISHFQNGRLSSKELLSDADRATR